MKNCAIFGTMSDNALNLGVGGIACNQNFVSFGGLFRDNFVNTRYKRAGGIDIGLLCGIQSLVDLFADAVGADDDGFIGVCLGNVLNDACAAL